MEEYCPYCNEYTDYELDDINSTGRIVCSHCHKHIHACAACTNQCKKTGQKVCFMNPQWYKKYHKTSS